MNRRLCVFYTDKLQRKYVKAPLPSDRKDVSSAKAFGSTNSDTFPQVVERKEYFSYYPNIVSLFKGSSLRRDESVPPLTFASRAKLCRFNGICAPLTGLLRGHFVLIVVEVLPAEEETELRVVLLLVLSHLLKLGPIARDKLRQFVYDVP